MNETVSAIITTYKRKPEVVQRALRSIERQTYRVSEIIVVDDNTIDVEGKKLSATLKNLCKNRAVYIKQPKGNAGANAARNLGIDNAHGDFIAFLDDDDEWLSEKIEKQMALFNENVGLVFCSGILHEELGGVVYESDCYNFNNFNSNPSYLDMLRSDCIGSTSQPIIKKTVFKKCGKFDEDLPARQDYDMWIRISKYYNIVGIPEKLFIRNMHENDQISRSKEKSYIAYKRLYEKYHDEYCKDVMAWLNIHVYITMNQKGLAGRAKCFLYRAARKTYKNIIYFNKNNRKRE